MIIIMIHIYTRNSPIQYSLVYNTKKKFRLNLYYIKYYTIQNCRARIQNIDFPKHIEQKVYISKGLFWAKEMKMTT